MANTYTQIHIQAVFTVQNRECIIAKQWKEEHHRKKTFLEEYKEFLNAFEVQYDERYIFNQIEY